MKKGMIFDLLDAANQSQSPENRYEAESSDPAENIIPSERTAFLLFPFFIQMIDQFKETLKNLEHQTRILQLKFRDQEPAPSLHRMIMEDIRKIDLLQKNVLNYISINNPVIKANTVNILLEEEMKKFQVELEEKKIKVFKTLENNLPETAVPDDQLRYIVSCVLQYVMTLIPHGKSFGLFTKSILLQRERGGDQAPSQKEAIYVEILLVYTGGQESTESSVPAPGIPARQKEGILSLALRLVDEIVQRNRGMMKIQEDPKKQKTVISLRFPVERRKIFYYRLPDELSPGIGQSKTTFEELSSLEEMKKNG